MSTETDTTETVAEYPIVVSNGEDFDKDRALRTIKAQREAEKALKAQLAEARKKAEAYDAAEAAKAEAEKTASERLAERDATIAELRRTLDERDIKDSFKAQAADLGVDDADLDLAYIAAREQGLLGSRDPGTGEVAKHNFDRLAELFPSLFEGGGAEGPRITGDAGRRGKGKALEPGDIFNRTVRDAIRRR